MTIKITENFPLEEIQHSDTAARKGIINKVPLDAYGVMKKLFSTIMQPLRDEIGPIKITSGYRCLKLNSIIGGSSRSQHIYSPYTGAACDFVHYNGTLSTINIINKILELKLDFDQLILEYPDTYSGGWVHISCGGIKNSNRNEIRVKEKDKPYIKLNPSLARKWDINLEEKKIV